MHAVIKAFDKFEDHVRGKLSHYPIIYALIGGVGIVLFWKGVWETAEYIPILFGLPSIVLGVVILLSTGLLVSFFIGDSIIISGITREKKLVEKTEVEVVKDHDAMKEIVDRLTAIEQKLDTPRKATRHAKEV